MASILRRWRTLRARVTGPRALPASAIEEIPRYPPFQRGLPAIDLGRLVSTQAELVDAIRQTLGMPAAEHAGFVVPVIHRYASFVHLLPASEQHHHRGGGGLLRHGLEVAFWAARASESVVFAGASTPRERRAQLPRWRAAACIAGLLHDLGKPVSDIVVTDRDGARTWNPHAGALHGWLSDQAIDRYFLRWRAGRYLQHEPLALSLIERMIGTPTLVWLTQGGPTVLLALFQAMTGHGVDAGLGQLVHDADRLSVERDQQAKFIEPTYASGVPVAMFIVDALRRLRHQAHWQVDAPVGVLWLRGDDVFVDWPRVAREVRALLDDDGVAGVPRDADSLADVLIEAGHASAQAEHHGARGRYAMQIPPGATEPVEALQIASALLIPVPSASTVSAAKEAVRRDAPQAIPPEAGDAHGHAGSPAVPDRVPASISAPGREVPGPAPAEMRHVDAIAAAAPGLQPSEPRGDTRALPMSGAPEPVPARASGPGDVPARADEAGPETPVDAWLQILLSRTASGDLQWGRELYRHGRNVILRYPDGLRDLPIAPARLVAQFDRAGWLELDPLAPMQTIRTLGHVRGVVFVSAVARRLVVHAPATGDAAVHALIDAGKPPEPVARAPAFAPDRAVPIQAPAGDRTSRTGWAEPEPDPVGRPARRRPSKRAPVQATPAPGAARDDGDPKHGTRGGGSQPTVSPGPIDIASTKQRAAAPPPAPDPDAERTPRAAASDPGAKPVTSRRAAAEELAAALARLDALVERIRARDPDLPGGIAVEGNDLVAGRSAFAWILEGIPARKLWNLRVAGLERPGCRIDFVRREIRITAPG
ncbi:MAG: MobH family relaxase [Gammaproteobacteria bacterium]